jgi:hypothetical protein
MTRLLYFDRTWRPAMDAPDGCWPWWSVELESGEVVEVVGMGRCGDQTAAARVLPRGSWAVALTPADAVSKVLRIPAEDGAGLFWGRR